MTRRRLQLLVSEYLINRQQVLIAHNDQQAAPVYYPSRKGCELLTAMQEVGPSVYFA